jgi:hypothetical protein
LASYLIKTAVETSNFLPKALSNSEMMNVFLETLKHLPTTPVDGAADNKVRQMIFEYNINEQGDYSAAAAVLSGMRMDDDKDSVYYFSAADKCDGKPIFDFFVVWLLLFCFVLFFSLMYIPFLHSNFYDENSISNLFAIFILFFYHSTFYW